ncbi:MAG: universal stress protein [Planctomycetota bacterium]|nr:universal stress protein [Planctomycetota bacterium]
MLKRIHLGLGGTPFTPTAIRYSVELARAHQAEILGTAIIDRSRLAALSKTSETGSDIIDEYRRLEGIETRQKRSIADFESQCNDAGISHAVTRSTCDPFEQMISQARYNDLMVFGLRSLFEFDFLETDGAGPLSRLVSSGVRPILAVAKDYRPIRRVLLAYSGSMRSASAIKQFVTMQLWPDLCFKLVMFDQPNEIAETLLNEMAGYCRSHGHEFECEHIEGSPKQQLLQHATDWNADLIVLGNGSRRLWLKKLLGDTAFQNHPGMKGTSWRWCFFTRSVRLDLMWQGVRQQTLCFWPASVQTGCRQCTSSQLVRLRWCQSSLPTSQRGGHSCVWSS